MKKLLLVALSLIVMVGNAACSSDNQSEPETTERSEQDEEGEKSDENSSSMKLRMTIGSVVFTATLTDNASARAFKRLLPITVNMNEMNGNEKFCTLPQSLPTAASNPRTINSGDIMLYGSSTLVLFYKTFSTSYSYTKIGSVDNPSGLERVLGNGNVSVVFELIND